MEQILKDCINEGIERKKRLTRWTKSILKETLERVQKVNKIRDIIKVVIDESVEQSDKEDRKRRKKKEDLKKTEEFVEKLKVTVVNAVTNEIISRAVEIYDKKGRVARG